MIKDTISLEDLYEGVEIPPTVDLDYNIFDSTPSTWDQVDAAREYMIKATESVGQFDAAMDIIINSRESLDYMLSRESDDDNKSSNNNNENSSNNQNNNKPSNNNENSSNNQNNNKPSNNDDNNKKENGFFGNVIKNIGKAFDAMIQFFKKMWGHIKNFFRWIWDCITGKNGKNNLKEKAEAIQNADLDEKVSREDANENNEKDSKESYYFLDNMSLESSGETTRRDLLSEAKLRLTDWPQIKRNVLDNNSGLPMVVNELSQSVKNEQYNHRDIDSAIKRIEKNMEDNTIYSNNVSTETIKSILTVASKDIIPSTEKYIKEFSDISDNLVNRMSAIRHSIGKSNNGEFSTRQYLDHLREMQKRYERLARYTKSGDMIVMRFAKMYNNDINKIYHIMKIKSKSVA